MTLFEAKPVDPRAEHRARVLKRAIWTLIVLALVAGALLWHFRYWPEEHVVDKFYTALEQKRYEDAFAIWNADPDWQKHTDRYKDYPFGQFQLDWGPTGDYGEIKQHDVKGADSPRSKIDVVSGVVVITEVNHRKEPNCLWVEKKSRQISYSHFNCAF